jgi:hypothetical protein
MKYVFLSLFFTFAMPFLMQAQVAFVVESPNNGSSAYPTFQQAYDAAEDGDFLYLPGTSVSIGNFFNLDKAIHLVGAGSSPFGTPATSPTWLTGNIRIMEPASGGSLTGVYLTGALYFGSGVGEGQIGASNYLIERCNVVSLTLSHTEMLHNGTHSVAIRDCVVRGSLAGGGLGLAGLEVSNTVIRSLSSFNSGAVLENCVIMGTETGQVTFGTVQGISLRSCIILNGNSSGNSFSGACLLENCYFTSSTQLGSNHTLINPTFNTENPFVGALPGTFEFTNDYHILPENPALTAGVNGTQCGIYGGDAPSKENWKPYNPHISTISIPNITDAQGNLNIQIGAEAQQY